MSYVIFNGSPRGKNSTSQLLANWFKEGIHNNGEAENQVSIYNLSSTERHDEYCKHVNQGDTIIMIFPLYADSMPGLVKLFMEKTEALKNRISESTLYFVVHSGFMEGHHSRFVEKYLERYSLILGAKYGGTAIMGGSESLYKRSEDKLLKKKEKFLALSKNIVRSIALDKKALRKLSSPEKLSIFHVAILGFIKKKGYVDEYWNAALRENQAFEDRYARPYIGNR